MAYFRCLIGSSGTGIPLIVTCSSAFAGLTITCTDGTTTLTDTCPSSSPYEITFNLPNTGAWDVSGTISGNTFTESVLVQDFNVELKNIIDLEVDFYSAANDTVSYIGALDGQTHTITTDSSGYASATITISGAGSTITFTSSVAKNPSDLTSDFSRAIALTSATSSVYVMPVDDPFYWYGYVGSEIEEQSAANGWTPYYSDHTWGVPTWNTNSVKMYTTDQKQRGIGTKIPFTANTSHIILETDNNANSGFGYVPCCTNSKNTSQRNYGGNDSTKSVHYKTDTISSYANNYLSVMSFGNSTYHRGGTLYAWWVD